MKVDPLPLVISVGISALLSYGLYNMHNGSNKELLAIGSFILFSSTLGLSFCFKLPNKGSSINIKTVAISFFVILLISNIIFCFVMFRSDIYIILNGIIFLVFILIIYGISKALK